MVMIIISSGINTGIGAWETENQVRRQDTWNFRQLNLEIGILKNQTLMIEIFKRNKWVNMGGIILMKIRLKQIVEFLELKD